jgi:hypothetical protein
MYNDYEEVFESVYSAYFGKDLKEELIREAQALKEIAQPPNTLHEQQRRKMRHIKMEEPIKRSDLMHATNDELLDTYNSNMFLYNLLGDEAYNKDAQDAKLVLKHRARREAN